MPPRDHSAIPYGQLETIFLDVGNTLVSMDYHWIQRELAALGIDRELSAIMRAEAKARPLVSRAVANDTSTEGRTIFFVYMKALIDDLGGASDPAETAEALVSVLRGPEREQLWSYVLPGVPEALTELRDLGLRLAVVSNSDGTVESVLERQGLRGFLTHVFDSHIVGFEKPDRRFFDLAVEQTGARPETTLHVGDLYSADIVGGRAAGLHTALVDPYDDWTAADCPRVKSVKALSETIRANLET